MDMKLTGDMAYLTQMRIYGTTGKICLDKKICLRRRSMVVNAECDTYGFKLILTLVCSQIGRTNCSSPERRVVDSKRVRQSTDHRGILTCRVANT